MSANTQLHAMGRVAFWLASGLGFAAIAAGTVLVSPFCLAGLVVMAPLFFLGLHDIKQPKRAILRNYPVVGHLRYLFEAVRPELQQYFIEQNLEGRPLNREERSVVYARAKKQLSTQPFGTHRDVYEVGYEWMNHSIVPNDKAKEQPRVIIGGKDCKQPYSASVLNISAMSFGSLSSAAIRALNGGAKQGSFFHNTGEGAVSDHHLAPGGDLCWQIGTGYFGCRTDDGNFSPELFKTKATLPNVKLIEIKLSQGAKPGKGGILPKEKITPEIAAIRHVPMDKDIISPAYHKKFSTPTGLLEFVKELRDLSGGKPVGFKLCLGKRREFFAICKAMIETGIAPDFITVDGGEGGTGAAPLEFSNSVGTPLVEGLITVHNALVGFGLRDEIRIIASGRVMTAFGMVKRLAIGADICNSARAFMLALGCIQALRCNMNDCPTGVATQDARLVKGLVVSNKTERVYQFHHETIKTLMELLAAAGLGHPSDLRPWHILRRTTQFEVHHYGEMFHYLNPGELLKEPLPTDYARAVHAASAATFGHAAPSESHAAPAK
jgi:glutamate synthase domain-containing protein 2